MKPLRPILTLLIILSIIACENQHSLNDEAVNDFSALVEEEHDSQSQNKQNVEISDRKLIKEGFIDFETENILDTKEQIYSAIKTSGAYVSAENVKKNNGKIKTNLIIRIPSDNFDSFIAEATKGVTEFDVKDISSKDVTEEFLDVQARIKTKKALENRYIKLLEKANEIKDILEIERQINILRTDIERIEGRLNYLQNRVAYSTVTINFYKTVASKNSIGSKFSNGFSSGWENLIWFIVSITYLWPFIFIAVVLIIGVKLYRRKKQNK
jgi:cytochrome b involved in lipid metabolism